jgi:hypothetical protein
MSLMCCNGILLVHFSAPFFLMEKLEDMGTKRTINGVPFVCRLRIGRVPTYEWRKDYYAISNGQTQPGADGMKRVAGKWNRLFGQACKELDGHFRFFEGCRYVCKPAVDKQNGDRHVNFFRWDRLFWESKKVRDAWKSPGFEWLSKGFIASVSYDANGQVDERMLQLSTLCQTNPICRFYRKQTQPMIAAYIPVFEKIFIQLESMARPNPIVVVMVDVEGWLQNNRLTELAAAKVEMTSDGEFVTMEEFELVVRGNRTEGPYVTTLEMTAFHDLIRSWNEGEVSVLNVHFAGCENQIFKSAGVPVEKVLDLRRLVNYTLGVNGTGVYFFCGDVCLHGCQRFPQPPPLFGYNH